LYSGACDIGRIFGNVRAKAAAQQFVNQTGNSVKALIEWTRAAEKGTGFLDAQRRRAEGPFLDFQRSQQEINKALRDVAQQLTKDFSKTILDITKVLRDNSEDIKRAGQVVAAVAKFILEQVPGAISFIGGAAQAAVGVVQAAAGRVAQPFIGENIALQLGESNIAGGIAKTGLADEGLSKQLQQGSDALLLEAVGQLKLTTNEFREEIRQRAVREGIISEDEAQQARDQERATHEVAITNKR